ncbi:MAG: hypothetical protein KAJ19_20760 [Gammaproteobacteria bacterium]|nr:hypothetical protein [Gammaproteobacteria bacterium]
MEHGEKETRPLEVKLTEKEFHKRVKEYAKLDKQIEEVEEEKKEANAEFKERIDALKENHTELREVVRTEKEERDIDCEWEADYEHSRWLLKRKDTGKTVESNIMTPDDLQGGLKDDDGKDMRSGAKGGSKKGGSKKAGGKSPRGEGKQAGERTEE